MSDCMIHRSGSNFGPINFGGHAETSSRLGNNIGIVLEDEGRFPSICSSFSIAVQPELNAFYF